MKKTITFTIAILFGVLVGVYGCIFMNTFEGMASPPIHTNAKLDSALIESRNSLITEVNKYIKVVAPKSRVSGKLIVDLCDAYNVDVRLVLVQGHVESHFGTKGTAAKTNSVFNVGAYDGHSAARQKRNGFGFSHPNQSIEPYLELLTTNYLVNGRTEEDLLKNYVNKYGQRYASHPKYEYVLRQRWNKIDTVADITKTYEEYKRYKWLVGC